VQREFSGLMAKPWRMVALHVGAWVSFALLQTGNSFRPGGLTVLDATLLAIILGCVQTVAIRLARIVRAIHGHARKLPAPGTQPEE
jgi:hypothetical protein